MESILKLSLIQLQQIKDNMASLKIYLIYKCLCSLVVFAVSFECEYIYRLR